MKMTRQIVIAMVVLSLGLVGFADADTIAVVNGNISQTSGWDNGLPASGNNGTIAVATTTNTTIWLSMWGAGSVVTMNAGGSIAGKYIRTSGAMTFNVTGGSLNPTVDAGPDGAGTAASIMNISGGSHTIPQLGAYNDGTLTISGSAVLATSVGPYMQKDGSTMNFLSSWTGSYTATAFSGINWEEMFTKGFQNRSTRRLELDGSLIDAATFNATFDVSPNGQTLSIPEPATMTLLAIGGFSVLLKRRRRA